jgi:hypothetical protein
MAKFSNDYPIELLRDVDRPRPGRVKKIMAKRMAWLATKMVERAESGQPFDLFEEELAAIAVMYEAYEKQHGSNPAQ